MKVVVYLPAADVRWLREQRRDPAKWVRLLVSLTLKEERDA